MLWDDESFLVHGKYLHLHFTKVAYIVYQVNPFHLLWKIHRIHPLSSPNEIYMEVLRTEGWVTLLRERDGWLCMEILMLHNNSLKIGQFVPLHKAHLHFGGKMLYKGKSGTEASLEPPSRTKMSHPLVFLFPTLRWGSTPSMSYESFLLGKSTRVLALLY